MKEWMKENWVYVIVVGLMLIFSGVAASKNFTSSKLQEEPRSEQTSPSEAETESEPVPETADEKNYRTAKLKLEHPYTESSEEEKEQVAQA
ncbi:hypothetical protein ACTGWY_10450, partial [Streptococcus suis]